MLVHDALTYWGRRTPDAMFVESESSRYTWAEADAMTNRIANALLLSGLVPGDRVAILGRNDVEVPLAFFGAMKAGLVPVPMNARLAPVEWEYIIGDAEARAVLVSGELLTDIDEVRSGLDEVRCWVAWGDAGSDLCSWNEWIAAVPSTSPSVPVGFDDDACQLYTSGTTGRPKGAVLTHSGLAVGHLRCHLAGFRLDPGEIFYLCLPVTLGGGLSMSLVAWVGGAGVRLANFDPATTVAALDSPGVAAMNITPTMVQMLLDVEGVDQRDYASLKWILYGGAPAPAALIRRMMATFGCGLIGVYGQTEFFTTVALTPEDHHVALVGREELLLSVGRPLPGVELAVLDLDGKAVPTGEQGEVCLRGVGSLRAYWRDARKTELVQAGGWHHSGDIGRVDADGYLYLVDRANDMIKSGGLNVYPREVEQVIETISGVQQVCVIGVPSERWGEEVKALVIRQDGSTLSETDVITSCRGRLGGYKIPKSVDFLDAFPLNTNGKVLKHRLRDRYRVAVGAPDDAAVPVTTDREA